VEAGGAGLLHHHHGNGKAARAATMSHTSAFGVARSGRSVPDPESSVVDGWFWEARRVISFGD